MALGAVISDFLALILHCMKFKVAFVDGMNLFKVFLCRTSSPRYMLAGLGVSVGFEEP